MKWSYPQSLIGNFLPAFSHSFIYPLTFPFFPANLHHILLHNSSSQDVLEHLFIFLLFLCFLDRFINILAVSSFHVHCSLSHSHSCMLPVWALDPGQYYQLSTTSHSWIIWVVELSHLRCRDILGLAVLLGEIRGCAAFGTSSVLEIVLVLYKISSTLSSCVPTCLRQKEMQRDHPSQFTPSQHRFLEVKPKPRFIKISVLDQAQTITHQDIRKWAMVQATEHT